MKAFISAFALFIWSAISMATVNATPLDGVWRDTKERIMLKIESTDNGIRTKRNDQDAWDYYTSNSNNRYTDSKGNYYAVKGENEIVWRENGSGLSIVYLRMYKTPVPDNVESGSRRTGSRDGDVRTTPSPTQRQRDQRADSRDNDDDDDIDDDNDDDNDRYNERYTDRHASRFASLNGQWFNQRNRQVINIQAADNGLRVYKGDRSRAMLFAPSRDSKVFKSRAGGTLTWLNANTIQLKTSGNQNLIFHRADAKVEKHATKSHKHMTKAKKEKSKEHGHGHKHEHAKKSK